MGFGLNGRFEHNIDAKGRVFVPAKLRDKLGESFIAAAVMDHCVCLYSQEEWDKLVESVGLIGNSKMIIDDTPETIAISGFDPVRREIARLTLEKLISDGRIHPARIEETVEKTKKELADSIPEDGFCVFNLSNIESADIFAAEKV